MILEGFKLAVIGMSIVFAFLVLLVLLIHLSTYLLRAITEKEALEDALQSGRKAREARMRLDGSRLIAVVSAAVSAHRARMQGLRKS
jgi:oxaloacetate decarboxylase (Na+ extruding) subunit gamma